MYSSKLLMEMVTPNFLNPSFEWDVFQIPITFMPVVRALFLLENLQNTSIFRFYFKADKPSS